MKNQYNLKDKKAQIYREFHGTDSMGYQTTLGVYPRAAAPLWCYTRQLSQDQIFAAHAYGQEETRLFVFNYYSGVAVYDLVEYRGTWYEITRVDTQDDYKGDLFIYVKNARGSKPHAEDIKPYDPSKWE